MNNDWTNSVKNEHIVKWVSEASQLMQPDSIYICNGSDDEYTRMSDLLVSNGTFRPLNQDKRPNSFLALSAPEDVARVEKRTFICSENEHEAGPTNNWIDPKDMRIKLNSLFSGCMKGRTMYVIPFCMGPINSPSSVYGIEITDSPYVVCSMKIMTRMGQPALEKIGNSNNFIKCHHSVGKPLAEDEKDVPWPCNPSDTHVVHFHDDFSIWSFGSGYGGNALLGKKCLALRIASIKGKREGWLAEHMLIVGITNPKNEKKYFAASFPSACGKTNLAMLKSNLPGWKIECIGDDIAWMHRGEDGRLYAINPEYGFFGVAPGTSNATNPNAMLSCSKNAIFTNVAETPDNDVWWEGMTKEIPAQLTDWKGAPWTKETKTPSSHPNSRFTAPLTQCPALDPAWDSSEGVPISAIIFGGRRETTIPLVYEALSWEHGVLIGAGMSSETTAAAEGSLGALRHDPFAMLPFCGYNMGDYLQNWIDFGKKLDTDKRPKIFGVNWFRKNKEGQFIWPGFGDNIRVLEWIFNSIDNKAESTTTPIGKIPSAKDLNINDLSLDEDAINAILSFDKTAWTKEIKEVKDYLQIFEDKTPKALIEELDRINSSL